MCGPSHNRLTMKLRDFKFQGPYHAQVFPKALEDMFFVVVVVKFKIYLLQSLRPLFLSTSTVFPSYFPLYQLIVIWS